VSTSLSNQQHYLHVFSSFCAAGAQVRAAALMRGFGAACRHTVVSMDGRAGAAGLAGDAEIRLVSYQLPGGPAAGTRFLRALLKNEQPDLLLSYNWATFEAVIAARSLGWRRLVHHEDGFNMDEAKRLKLRRNWARRLLLKNADVVVPSRRLETIARDTWRLQRLFFIPNGIDAAAFGRDRVLGTALRESLGIPAEALVVGAVGHLLPVKNYSRLIRIIATIDIPVQLLLVGDGAERAKLEALAKSSGITAHFTGHMTDVRAAYSTFDIFAISSDSEQQPVSLLEAMAAGLPVCGTDVGDVKSTLPDSGHEFVVPLGPDTENRLAGMISQLAKDAGCRAALGAANRRRVQEDYSEIAMLAAYARVYEAAQSR